MIFPQKNVIQQKKQFRAIVKITLQQLQQSFLLLKQWFENHQRILPWRNHPTPYYVWISEIMLQQTQVATVIPYFDRFISRFPNENKLAQADINEIYQYWAGLGYYSRALNLHKAAQIIANSQQFPQSQQEWEKLPGVGPYTSAAIVSIAYLQCEPVLDTNVKRVLARVRRVKNGKNNKKYLKVIARLFINQAQNAGLNPSVYNQGMMEIGALLCKPKNPLCQDCPLIAICQAKDYQQIDQYPEKKSPKQWKKITEKSLVLLHNNQVLLIQNHQSRWRKGLWDIPELKEFHIKPVKEQYHDFEIHYTVTHHKIQRLVWITQLIQNQKLDEFNLLNYQYQWYDFNDPQSFQGGIGSAGKKCLNKIKSFINEE
ncbi:MAG: A/G-specific adenine glycosylase [Spirochaetes bacterium]|nr:A/G-specific adenine glycosylase [Spirochaetota bacterium]